MRFKEGYFPRYLEKRKNDFDEWIGDPVKTPKPSATLCLHIYASITADSFFLNV
ncbi:MAG: hypothetical protein K2J79_05025 [Ruminiclostridium sp.]|nr:hypothetical protein [Ruminiclostridium sp.]